MHVNTSRSVCRHILFLQHISVSKVATCEVSDTGYQLGNPFATQQPTNQESPWLKEVGKTYTPPQKKTWHGWIMKVLWLKKVTPFQKYDHFWHFFVEFLGCTANSEALKIVGEISNLSNKKPQFLGQLFWSILGITPPRAVKRCFGRMIFCFTRKMFG